MLLGMHGIIVKMMHLWAFLHLFHKQIKFGTMPNHSDFASASHFQLHPLICYQCFTTHWYQDVRIWNTPHICIAVPCILIGWTINYVYTVMYLKPPAIPTLAIRTTASQQRILLFLFKTSCTDHTFWIWCLCLDLHILWVIFISPDTTT